MSNLTPEQMENSLQHAQQNMEEMLLSFMDAARVRLAATATDKYMQDPGFTSPPFPPRESTSGPLRILSGRLARSLTGARSFTSGGSIMETQSIRTGSGGDAHPENISKINTTEQGVKMTYGSKTPYAYIHEHGFTGTVNIPEHTRNIDTAFGKAISARSIRIKAHKRHMRLPARPYLNPSWVSNRPALENMLAEDFQNIILEAVDG